MGRLLPLSAHLGYLFTEIPLEQRFSKARELGFTAVEHPAPFDLEPELCRKLLSENGLLLAQVTSGMGRDGEKGTAALPGREDEFKKAFWRSLEYAEQVGCPFVHVMAGVNGDRAVYLQNLEWAVRQVEGRRSQVLIEAISEQAVFGYHLSAFEDALGVARRFDGAVKVLLDTFHVCAGGLDPLVALESAGDLLGHVHIADYPTRAEPGSGTIKFDAFLSLLSASAYDGAVGFEYTPSSPDSFQWMEWWQAKMGTGK